MARKRLTEENKAEIHKLSKQGYSKPALAAKYNVSRQTIHRILNPEYYARTLAKTKEYQRENAEKIQRQRAAARREYKLSFSFEKDAKIIDHLDKQENVNDYIRGLVIDDIK